MTVRGAAVIDASYMIEVLLGGADLPSARLAAPAHFDAEVTSTLMRLHRRGIIGVDDAIELARRLPTLGGLVLDSGIAAALVLCEGQDPPRDSPIA